jgi:hypothetical protein
MNDSYAVLADMQLALAAERTRSLLTEARYDALARAARTAAPRPAARRLHLLQSLGHAQHAVVLWLRKGQLAGYPSTCQTC